MKRFVISSIAAIMLHAAATAQEPMPSDWVDPFIGTTNFGTTNPGAVCPNGMMAVVPFNVTGSDKNAYDKDSRWWSTPYEYENRFFTGFAHGALSGVGCPEMGALLTSAAAGEPEADCRLYGSEYSDETARPGYYAATLTKYGIRAEATATLRSSAERYTFRAGRGNIILNLGAALSNECGAAMKRVSETEVEGMRLLGSFCYNPQAVFPVYFVVRVSRRPSATLFWKRQPVMSEAEAQWDQYSGQYKIYTSYGREMAGDDVGCIFTFDDLGEGEQVEVRMGISYVSTENARMNLEAEQHGASFDELRDDARRQWNDALGRIRVSGGTDRQRTVFYTALYHTLIHPNLLNDVNGQYPMMERSGETGLATDGDRYTVFSLWDTYRNLHQLMTLVYPERQTEMVRSMVGMYREWGWLPKWELYGRETFTMEGDPAIPVIVDTWRKGLRDFDMDAAYEAMKKSATTPEARNPMRPDADPYNERGYIPVGHYAADMSGDNSVSHALEYYVADNALAWLAAERGDDALAATLRRRAAGYRNYYSRESGTLRPLTADGRFVEPFDPRQGENFEAVVGFHEGSAWNYTFYVPHDVEGLARLMGGSRKFVDKLQRVFDEGLYDPANEPDIAYPYLFSRFGGEEWRTQREVRRLLEQHFTPAPDGIPGNDDAGTMSAWAVFSMLGLYPDCPAEPYYTLTSPVFDRAEIDTGRGKTIVIEARRPSEDAIYIKSMALGGRRLTRYRISHDELMEARRIEFELKTDKR